MMGEMSNVALHKCHAEALRLLVTAVFPSATITFSGCGSSGMAVGEEDMMEDALFARLDERLRQGGQSPEVATGHSGGKKPMQRHVPFPPGGTKPLLARGGPATAQTSSTAADVWPRLYRKWPPQLVAGRQLWRYDAEKLSETSPLLPSWTPHAVVYIGGFEAPDLRQVVAPQIFASVPPFSSINEPNRTVGGKTFDYRESKVPKFASRVLDTAFLIREKGCAIHDPDLLEIALPVTVPCSSNDSSSSSSGCGRNNTEIRCIPTFLSFAGSEPNIHALQVAVDPMHRRALRPAFGYSIAALKFALPPPVVSATRLLRQWNAVWSPTPLSTAFWLSAVGHAVERRLSLETEAVSLLLGETPCTLLEASKSLAFVAASLINSTPEECWNNYFLPVERLEVESGVRDLSKTVNLLPVTELL